MTPCAVDTEHHLIVAHEVTNSGSDRAQLANMARQAKAVLKTETLEVVADRGYFSSPQILACHEAGMPTSWQRGSGRRSLRSWPEVGSVLASRLTAQ
ncbi:hypothetical protein JQ636_24665 [Bradyrhizobium japonicum]|nr:hypothetical protein [Bradyrhizobium japonicum]